MKNTAGIGGLLLSLGASVVVAYPAHAAVPAAAPADFTRVTQIFERRCHECHAGATAKGDLALDVYRDMDEPAAKGDRDVWLAVRERIKDHDMPPESHQQPSADEHRAMLAWLDAAIDSNAGAAPDPGRVTVRRLNRAEFQNTVRDLFGVEVPAARLLPPDNVGYGFDNIGDVLTVSPLLLERYLLAAEYIAVRAAREHLCADDPARAQEVPAAPSARPALLAAVQVMANARTPAEARPALHAPLYDVLTRMFRRPATSAEITRLTTVALAGLSPRRSARAPNSGNAERLTMARTAIGRTLAVALLSPHFVFRIEPDPAPAPDAGGAAPPPSYPLSDYALASRLSYFLWSSTPDDPLLDLAAQGRLRDEGVLDAQVRRLLADPRARALVDNFASQWLRLRKLDTVSPDRHKLPAFDEDLRRSMRRETELFFSTLISEDRDILDLVDADFTFVNQRLARHYGLAGVTGPEFRRVSLAGTPRAGILTHGSILTVTSNAGRTSPVKRGKFVLERLLGTPPPPPPPDTPELRATERKNRGKKLSVRALLELHRSDPNCASCHTKMDAFGFALENFDPLGEFRTNDGVGPVDASGSLPGGITFVGAAAMRKVLRGRAPQIRRAVIETLLTYALGRGTERADLPSVEGIVRHMHDHGDRFTSLITGIVRSPPFQQRNFAPPPAAPQPPAPTGKTLAQGISP